jgi:hypothetical protein
MLRHAMTSLPALAILRRASWRRCGAALAILALLLQGFGTALLMRAAVASWDEAAAICHGIGDDSSGAAGTSGGNDAPYHHDAACPFCLALHHCGTVLPPAATAVLVPPAATSVTLAAAEPVRGGGRVDRPHLPRGPPLSG